MKAKPDFKKYALCWAIIFILFQIITFLLPAFPGETKYTPSFWTGYGFITVAFIGQLICTWHAFQASNAQKLFLNLPLITVSYAGTILILLVGGVCMLVPMIPYWIGVIVSCMILAFTAVGAIQAATAAEAVNAIDEKIKAQTDFIYTLTSEAGLLPDLAVTDASKATVKQIYEAIRYSDPMSHAQLEDIEGQIRAQFKAFSDAVAAKDASSIESEARQLTALLKARNQKCKLLK